MFGETRIFISTTFALFLAGVVFMYGCSSSGNMLTLDPPEDFDASSYQNPKDYGQPINIKNPLKDLGANKKTFIPASIEGGFENAREKIDTPSHVLRNRIEGLVVIKAYIDAEGKLTNLNVIKSPEKILTKITWESIKTWNFNAAQLDGEPVKSVIHIPVEHKVYAVKVKREVNRY